MKFQSRFNKYQAIGGFVVSLTIVETTVLMLAVRFSNAVCFALKQFLIRDLLIQVVLIVEHSVGEFT